MLLKKRISVGVSKHADPFWIQFGIPHINRGTDLEILDLCHSAIDTLESNGLLTKTQIEEARARLLRKVNDWQNSRMEPEYDGGIAS